MKKLLPQIALLLFGFITSNVCAQANPVPINLNNLGPEVNDHAPVPTLHKVFRERFFGGITVRLSTISHVAKT
ncbi:MAG: hypothetical protein LC802_21490 [Acidobacteria bacterium]|nr:hypothetical protein [Acidobacteriota bacterium]